MEKEIKLPTKLAKLGLSHQEIGALFVILSLDDMNKEERLLWEEDATLEQSIQKLVDREIVKIHPMDEELTVDLSFLDKERPFWEIWDYDSDNNPIYFHPSGFTSDDESGCYSYRIKPAVRDGKLVYVYCGDFELVNIDDYIYTSFSSLEDAQSHFEELIKEENLNEDDYKEWRNEL